MTGLISFSALLVIVTIASIHVETTSGLRPGLKVRITQPGINYAAKVAVSVLTKDIKGRAIPDKSGKSGRVSYYITGTRVTNFVAPSSGVTMKSGVGASFSLQGCSAAVHGNWKYKTKIGWFTIRDSGSFDVSASGLGITMTVQIGAANGKPTIKAVGCSSRVGSLRLKLRGGASWLYNLFAKFFINKIKATLRDLMCSAAVKAINTSGTTQLQKLKQKVAVHKVLELDYSLIANPLFASNYMETSHKGEVFYKGDNTEAPFQPGVMPAGTASGRMVDIWASDYILNTMGFVLHKHKLISYRLTKNNLSSKDRYMLGTTCPGKMCMGTILPKVASKYPNSFFEISMATTSPPKANFLANMIRGTFAGNIIYYVRRSNSQLIRLCTMRVTVTVSVSVRLDGNKLKGTVSGFSPKISLSGLCPDGMSASSMTKMLTMVGNVFIVPNLNELGKKGLEIPSMDNVAYKNPILKFRQGSLQISADILYPGVPAK